MTDKYINRKLELEKVGFELDQYLVDIRYLVKNLISEVSQNDDMNTLSFGDSDGKMIFFRFDISKNVYICNEDYFFKSIYNKYGKASNIKNVIRFFVKKYIHIIIEDFNQIYYYSQNII